MSSRELLVLVGIPASGKSTYAKTLVEHVIVSKDSMSSRSNKEQRQMREIADACAAGFHVAVDNCNLTVAVRAPLIAHAVQLNMRPIAVYFDPDLKVSIERNMKRPKKTYVPEFVVRNMFNATEIPSLREGFEEVRHVRC